MDTSFSPAQKALIEKGRKDFYVMELCKHEYLADAGEHPPENWEPTDKEVFAVIDRLWI
ncbi:hypothetical protein K7I13_12195 [Brucepastera parasyntrophica]|uniref:hypothetical protein n=1 Tax=Brucepastera parasyntrophica TaxID=2880008 RepID=UPI00210EB9F9|nr:hypothetical protein [Brucepastera parasyntrophica]ULQ59246.1 hypothetical protein K7I13_12195 [Brucepastera parasyntrophica]